MQPDKCLSIKYDVGKLLGFGTFGKVYQATQRNNNNAPCAIKVIEQRTIDRQPNKEKILG